MEIKTQGTANNSEIILFINGLKIGPIKSYTAKSTREVLPLEALESLEVTDALYGRVTHEITIERPFLSFNSSISDFFSLDKFNVDIQRGNTVTTFPNCIWTEVTESGNPSERVVDSLKAVSFDRYEQNVDE